MLKRVTTCLLIVLTAMTLGIPTAMAGEVPAHAAAPAVDAAPAPAPATEESTNAWLDELTSNPGVFACNDFCCTSNLQCRNACGDAAACVGTGFCKRCILL